MGLQFCSEDSCTHTATWLTCVVLTTHLFWCARKPYRVGVRLGIWCGLGCGHLPVWRSCVTSVWQRIRGNLLQGAQDCSWQRLASLVPTPPARCCALNCCCCHLNPCHHVTSHEDCCILAHSLPNRHKFRLVDFYVLVIINMHSAAWWRGWCLVGLRMRFVLKV